MEKQLGLSRRHLIKFGTVFLGTGTLATVLGTDILNYQPVIAQNNSSPDEAFKQLMEGNKRFVSNKRKNPNQSNIHLTEVAKGQSPFAAVLSCADSRVPVEIIFDRGLGDVFVVRNAGNVSTSEEIGSLEFGTLVLGAKVLIVIGHESCGAVQATLKGDPVPGSIQSVLDQIKPGVTEYKGQQNDKKVLEKATKLNVLAQIEKLKLHQLLPI